MRNTNIVLDEKVAYTEKNLGNLDSMSSKRKITSRKNRTFLTVVKDIRYMICSPLSMENCNG